MCGHVSGSRQQEVEGGEGKGKPVFIGMAFSERFSRVFGTRSRVVFSCGIERASERPSG